MRKLNGSNRKRNICLNDTILFFFVFSRPSFIWSDSGISTHILCVCFVMFDTHFQIKYGQMREHMPVIPFKYTHLSPSRICKYNLGDTCIHCPTWLGHSIRSIGFVQFTLRFQTTTVPYFSSYIVLVRSLKMTKKKTFHEEDLQKYSTILCYWYEGARRISFGGV